MAVTLAPQAILDIEDIYIYSRTQWDQATADRYRNALFVALDLLGTFPERGKLIRSAPSLTRFLPIRKHIAYYRQDGSDVLVLRIMHERQHYEATLLDDSI